MARNPFQFLDGESESRRLLLLLEAIIRKQGGEIRLSIGDVTSIEDGSCVFRSVSGDELVLRFAEKAEAIFLLEGEPRQTRQNLTRQSVQPLQPSNRHAIHDDIAMALKEEELANRLQSIQKERLQRARAEAGAMPWRNEKPQ